jgi:ubiquitin C-terminal hydrolase
MHDALPLQYRLSSVIAHTGGGAAGGHYMASVRGQGGQMFAISDTAVQNFTHAEFLASPQRPRRVWDANFTVYVLTYLREEGQLTKGQREVSKLV